MKKSIVRRLGVVPLVLALVASLPALAQESSYGATLSPLAGGSAQCRGSFTFRDLGKQLTYRLVCDNLTGDPTTINFAGPAHVNVMQAIEIQAVPISGTTTLSDNETQLLKTGRFFVEICTSGHPDGEVGGPMTAK